MNIIHFFKSTSGSRLSLFGITIFNRGDVSAPELTDNTRWFQLTTELVNIRTKNHSILHRYKDVVCGKPVTEDVPIGPSEEIITSEGLFVVQPAQRRTTYKRFAKPEIDPRNFYFIITHPYRTKLGSRINLEFGGIVANTPIEATVATRRTLDLLEDMKKDMDAMFLNKSE